MCGDKLGMMFYFYIYFLTFVLRARIDVYNITWHFNTLALRGEPVHGRLTITGYVKIVHRARHCYLPRNKRKMPQTTKICNLWLKGKWKLYIACPTDKYAVYISGVLLRTCASFVVWHPNLSKKICCQIPVTCTTWFWM